MIAKPCRRSIAGEATTPVYKEKIKLSFQDLPSFVRKEKLAKFSYFLRGCCFTHSLEMFATQWYKITKSLVVQKRQLKALI